MCKNESLKIFIAYSHLDEGHVNEFIKHTAPLKNNELIENWYDRKITAGKDYQDTIDNNLNEADIICLFISANFLHSPACMKEIKEASKLNRLKGTLVIPIILSDCGWHDVKEISPILALPRDGVPISDFTNVDKAWKSVYDGLKEAIEEEVKYKNIEMDKDHLVFLQSTELLTKAHSEKENIYIDDIFIYPELEKYDFLREYEKKESSKTLISNLQDHSKILIAGENQSGKTTLCKIIIKKLRTLNFIPVYISAKSNTFQGNIGNIVYNAYKEQYLNLKYGEVDKKRIVIILDDFHLAKHKEKHMAELQEYEHHLIIVDDIFSFNVRDENLISNYSHYKISEFRPTQRNDLIKKWNDINGDKTGNLFTDNDNYKLIDDKYEQVNTTLGKIIGNGIMPSYPFFILSILSTFETFTTPLEQEITSQGYCYQAFIYIYLRNQGVKNDDIDIYINFLTEFSFYFYKEKKKELSFEEFKIFMEIYLESFNLPIDQDQMLINLDKSSLIKLDSFGNYSFYYEYIYYFFVAKYLAENIDNNKDIINSIIANLHKDENSYIGIFISHHSNNDYILDEIVLNADSLFEKYKPATLKKEELSFFDKQVGIIVDAALPSANETPEKERADRLKERDLEERYVTEPDVAEIEDIDTDLALELRRSIKTVEVMGRIIKNRAGSLKKEKLEFIFEEAMKVHLRILTSFFAIIDNDEGQQSIVAFISDRIDKIIEEKERKPSKEKLKQMSTTIFWNMNFFTVYGFFDKMIHSLGSNKLTEIIEKVCDKEDTPASFLLKHGIFMWYDKNLQVDNISKRISEDGFSRTAKKVIEFMIVNHCSMHHIGFKDIQKIQNKFNISPKDLLLRQAKINN